MASVSVAALYGNAWAFAGLLYGLKSFVVMLVAGNRYFEGVVAVALGLGVVEGSRKDELLTELCTEEGRRRSVYEMPSGHFLEIDEAALARGVGYADVAAEPVEHLSLERIAPS